MASGIEDLMKGGGAQSKVVQSVMGMLSSNSKFGGVSGLVERFQSKGMGDKAQSWVGTGANSDVSGNEVCEALGDNEVQKVADDAGVSKEEAADGIAKVLPHAVDEMTPSGSVPQAGQAESALSGLKSKFGL